MPSTCIFPLFVPLRDVLVCVSYVTSQVLVSDPLMLTAAAETTSPHNSCDFVRSLIFNLKLVVKVPPRLDYQSGNEALVAVSSSQLEHLALVPPLFLPTTLWSVLIEFSALLGSLPW